jgi:hypothetical protein
MTLEVAHNMLQHNGLNLKIWAKTLNTTVYLKARNPHKDVNEMTSKEVWSGKKPFVKHFWVFGCVAYA